MALLFQPLKSLLKRIGNGLHQAFKIWTKQTKPSQLLGTLADWNRSKSELVAENALLRKPLIVLHRQSKLKRAQFSRLDRFLIIYSPEEFRPGNRLCLFFNRIRNFETRQKQGR